MLEKLLNVQKELRTAPELNAVEVIEVDQDGLRLTFKEGTIRTGKELLKVQDVLFKNGIFSFIKNEKVELFAGHIKSIGITIY